MKDLPKLPIIRSGIQYPPHELEDRVDKVTKTNPAEYVKHIKELLKEVQDYTECLEYLGYTVNGIEKIDLMKVYAKKEIIIS
jgi:hypothetical protein